MRANKFCLLVYASKVDASNSQHSHLNILTSSCSKERDWRMDTCHIKSNREFPPFFVAMHYGSGEKKKYQKSLPDTNNASYKFLYGFLLLLLLFSFQSIKSHVYINNLPHKKYSRCIVADLQMSRRTKQNAIKNWDRNNIYCYLNVFRLEMISQISLLDVIIET